MKDVLIINSYAGSLVLGCKAAGFPIRGSYEDAAFGIEAQKLNFPELRYVDRLPWPEDDLSETVVIAHPPCAPFSIMNPMKGDKSAIGTTADGFQCHRNVMDYALGSGCKALAIESVTGVLKAADEYHQKAAQYGYNVCFLRVNSIGFGVPQWRARVWIIFYGEKSHHLDFTPFDLEYRPVYRPLKTGLMTEGTIIQDFAKPQKQYQAHLMIKKAIEAGAKPELLRDIFEGEYGEGNFLQLAQSALSLEPSSNFENVRKTWKLGGLFAAMMPRILNSEGWCPTILGGSAWFVHGRPLFLEEYNQIMGFPADYQWPEKFRDPRLYLSKGVCPPVATWILQQIAMNFSPDKPEFELGTYYRRCLPGEVLDLCPKKREVEDALAGRPEVPPRVQKTRGPKQERKNKAAPVRVRATASELAANFLKSLGE